MTNFPVIPSEAARRAAQSRDLFLSTHRQKRSLRSAPVGMTGWAGDASRQFRALNANSAPDRMPVGQRAVTVLSLV